MSVDHICQHQSQDIDLKPIIDYLSTGALPRTAVVPRYSSTTVGLRVNQRSTVPFSSG